MRIDTSGNVGIGVTLPGARLHVKQTTNTFASGIMVERGSAPSTQGALYMGADNQLYVQAGSATGGYITIQQGGNVGIGTATPGSKLSVAGTIESTSGGIKFPDATTQTTAATVKNVWMALINSLDNTAPGGSVVMGVLGQSGETSTPMIVPIPGTAKNMRCSINTALGSGKSWAIALRKNAISSALTCTIADTATTCSDLTDTVTFVAGDTTNWLITPTSLPAGTIIRCSLEFDPS